MDSTAKMLKWLKNIYHYLWALCSAVFYRFPSKKLKVIGVTGTQGKSTVVEFIGRILEEGGFRVASISSIRFKIKEKEWENTLKMTMPGRFGIQRFLRKALEAGCDYAVLEVTSEGILQHRHRFVDFDIGVFTNLSPEHIERHKGFENYRRAKGKLFQQTRIHIINLDDKNAQYFSQFPAEEKYGYTTGELKINNKLKTGNWKFVRAEEIKCLPEGIGFKINGIPFKIKLLGLFNVYNALAAVCVGLSQGISLNICQKALRKVEGIPGRMEVVLKKPFTVIVDYAHTPYSLKNVYQNIRNFKLQTSNVQNPKLICVLGACGGGRDKWKRPVLGKIATQYCDKIVLTNEDPYDEDPYQILSEIKSGVLGFQFPISNFYEILDRRKAIRKALELAKPNDIVIITGKGCEPWMCVAKGKKIPWDDRKIVQEEFDKLNL